MPASHFWACLWLRKLAINGADANLNLLGPARYQSSPTVEVLDVEPSAGVFARVFINIEAEENLFRGANLRAYQVGTPE